MFMNLNKKFIYTFFLFFTLIAGVFIAVFQAYYDKVFDQSEQNFITNSSEVLSILHNNSYVTEKIKQILKNNPEIMDNKIKTMLEYNHESQSKKLIASLNELYNKKYDRIQWLFKIMIITISWVIISVILLWIMIRQMVLKPINRLISVSEKVSMGDLSQRVDLQEQLLKDEFFVLSSTFDYMLNNTQKNIIRIRNNQYFLQSLIDAIPDGIRVIDEDGKIILANSAYKKLFRVNVCVGEYCYKQMLNIDRFCPENRFLCPLRELKKNGMLGISTIQHIAKCQNKPVSVSAARMEIGENEQNKKYIIESIRDLSGDIKFSHQQKISSLAFLATSIAHEMKNNLGSLRLILEQLLDTKNNVNTKKKNEFLSLAYSQLLECIKIPESLLNLSRNSSPQDDNVNLNLIVKDILVLMDYESKRKGIEMNFNAEKTFFVLGNEPDFKMIFLNLFQNAIKAMPSGGSLTVTMTEKNKKVEVLVKDTGIGIEKEKLHRIFEPFFSTSSKSQNSVGGTGLGLSIVKSLVENFKGKVKVSSEVGKGTIFTLLFPLK